MQLKMQNTLLQLKFNATKLNATKLQRRELLAFSTAGAEVAGGDGRPMEEAETVAGRRGVRPWTRVAEAMAATGRSTAGRVRRRRGCGGARRRGGRWPYGGAEVEEEHGRAQDLPERRQ